MIPFIPRHVATVNIDVASSSARVLVATGNCPRSVRVMNNGTATAWIEFGDSAVTAALATGVPVGPGVTEILTASLNGPGTGSDLYAAAIAAGSTGKIYFTPGDGI